MFKLAKKLIAKYYTFIKYVFSAGISFLLDLGLFTLFSYLLKTFIKDYAIIVATISARVISSFINYHINRNSVFKRKSDGSKIDSKTFTKYVTLVIIQMLVSSFSVYALHGLTGIHESLIKVPVECILFVVNYFVQKLFIFNDKTEPAHK